MVSPPRFLAFLTAAFVALAVLFTAAPAFAHEADAGHDSGQHSSIGAVPVAFSDIRSIVTSATASLIDEVSYGHLELACPECGSHCCDGSRHDSCFCAIGLAPLAANGAWRPLGFGRHGLTEVSEPEPVVLEVVPEPPRPFA